MELIGQSPFVLLGEASHGTYEFYRERARITQRLIEEKGFTAVAVEADWPDAYRVNRYVRGAGDDVDAEEALSDFRRFPRWMWRNTVVVDFVEWLRTHNDAISFDQLRCEKELAIIPGAMHLFEEPGALGQVAQLAREWFQRYLAQREAFAIRTNR